MARKGRKRKQVKREPNGRASRRKVDVREREEMTEKQAKEVVLSARRRHTGLRDEFLDLQDAGRPNAGTVHGALRLREAQTPGTGITSTQFAAAEWVIGHREAYLRAIHAPERGAVIVAPSGEGSEDKYAKWCREQRERWQDIVICIAEASVSTRSPLMSAVDTMLFRQQMMPHMLGDLRYALTAIDRQFLSTSRAAA